MMAGMEPDTELGDPSFTIADTNGIANGITHHHDNDHHDHEHDFQSAFVDARSIELDSMLGIVDTTPASAMSSSSSTITSSSSSSSAKTLVDTQGSHPPSTGEPFAHTKRSHATLEISADLMITDDGSSHHGHNNDQQQQQQHHEHHHNNNHHHRSPDDNDSNNSNNNNGDSHHHTDDAPAPIAAATVVVDSSPPLPFDSTPSTPNLAPRSSTTSASDSPTTATSLSSSTTSTSSSTTPTPTSTSPTTPTPIATTNNNNNISSSSPSPSSSTTIDTKPLPPSSSSKSPAVTTQTPKHTRLSSGSSSFSTSTSSTSTTSTSTSTSTSSSSTSASSSSPIYVPAATASSTTSRSTPARKLTRSSTELVDTGDRASDDSDTDGDDTLATPSKRRASSDIHAGSRKRQSFGSRGDKSLWTLTTKFLELVQATGDGTVDLSDASKKLGVQKRRIYDITNVLEGIGLVTKKSKNNIQWKGGFVGSTTNLTREVSQLKEEEQRLDQQLERMKQRLLVRAQDPLTTPHAFVSVDDVYHLEDFERCSLIVIRAPAGTTLDVPEPDESADARYEILLKSSGGEIDVFLLENKVEYPQPVEETFATADPNALQPYSIIDNQMTLVVPAVGADYFLGGLAPGEGIAELFEEVPFELASYTTGTEVYGETVKHHDTMPPDMD